MQFFSKEEAKKEHDRKQRDFTEKDLFTVLKNSSKLKSRFIGSKRLSGYLVEFKLLISMLKDYYNQKYKTVPWYIISSVGATLLYVLTSVDLLPDFIPFVGFIDDATVFGICINLVRTEIEKYARWKEEN